MMRLPTIWTAATLLFLLGGCGRKESGGSVAEAYLADDSSVAFDLEILQSGNGSQQWRGTYASQGKVAKFRIEFGPARPAETEAGKDFNLKSGEGRFAPEAGSDASVLLADLGKALQAKVQPRAASIRTRVPFTFANIGENLSQATGGGFGADQEGEVFLNLNPKIGKGQFSMKDAEYGDLVLTELAKVL